MYSGIQPNTRAIEGRLLWFHTLGDPRFRRGIGQMPIAFGPPKARFAGQQDAGDPALVQVRGRQHGLFTSRAMHLFYWVHLCMLLHM